MTRRIERVNELIKQELSKVVKREVDFPLGVLVTVTRVETSQDLEQTNVYISCVPTEKIREIIDLLYKNIYQIQGRLNKILKIKILPRINFMEEKETEKAAEIERILEKIKKGDKMF